MWGGGGELQILINDDGVGFDMDALLQDDAVRNSYGLISMEERAQLAGGRMEVESSPGEGTRLRFLLPVPSCC